MDATATQPAAANATPSGTAVPPVEEEKKEGAVDGEDETPKPMYERYEYLDPRKFTPICTLKCSLISPQWGHLSKLPTEIYNCFRLHQKVQSYNTSVPSRGRNS